MPMAIPYNVPCPARHGPESKALSRSVFHLGDRLFSLSFHCNYFCSETDQREEVKVGYGFW